MKKYYVMVSYNPENAEFSIDEKFAPVVWDDEFYENAEDKDNIDYPTTEEDFNVLQEVKTILKSMF